MARTNLPTTKQKRSFTLSPDSVHFLDQLKRKRKVSSLSLVLEEIVQTAKKTAQSKALDKAVDQYYSTLNPQDLADDTAWGDFALQEFPGRDH